MFYWFNIIERGAVVCHLPTKMIISHMNACMTLKTNIRNGFPCRDKLEFSFFTNSRFVFFCIFLNWTRFKFCQEFTTQSFSSIKPIWIREGKNRNSSSTALKCRSICWNRLSVLVEKRLKNNLLVRLLWPSYAWNSLWFSWVISTNKSVYSNNRQTTMNRRRQR